MVPNECHMPDLADLNPILPGFMTSVIGFKAEHLSVKEHGYYRVFIRLVDKAIRNYLKAREAILTEISEGTQVFTLFSFVNYMENSLNAIRRLYRVLSAVKNEKDKRLTVNRLDRRALEASVDEIKDVRNIFEHIDEKIQNGELVGPVMLAISDDDKKVEISGYSISFDCIARVLRQFHKLGMKWIEDFVKPQISK